MRLLYAESKSVVVRVVLVSAGGPQRFVGIRVFVLHVTLDLGKRLHCGLEVGTAVCAAHSVAQGVIAVPKRVECEYDILIPGSGDGLAKVISPIGKVPTILSVGAHRLL